MQFGDMGQGTYRKPSEQREAAVAGKRKRDADVSKARSVQSRQFAEGARRQKAREAVRKEAIHRKVSARSERERNAQYDQVQDVYEPGEGEKNRTQEENTRLALTMRGSDRSIVAAHESAYGAHDPTQDIVDAHQSAYGDAAGEQVASNDQ
jgi:hypothetical protein